MTDKPKSLTTEIEWFSPEMKLPENQGTSILILKISNEIEMAYVNLLDEPEEIFASNFIGFTPVDEIKYWAYLPDLSEFE